jgi:hypothetical protein
MAKSGLELVTKGLPAESRSKKPSRRGSKKPKEAKEAKPRAVPARARVRKAQLNVLEQVENILNGNCKSATNGNHGCAKFVLDWSGVSELRTPLAKQKRKSSLADALLKKLKQAAEQKPKLDEVPQQK